MNTDKDWEKWGQKDPYFGVLADDKFRNQNIDADAKAEFFESGKAHMADVFQKIKQHIEADFAPTTALDFGCGTGRLVIPLATMTKTVVGVDISDSMLAEARKNCQAYSNVIFHKSDDTLSEIRSYSFDFVHTFIVLQHIPVERVRIIFEQLLQCLKKGGVGAIHLTYAKMKFINSYGTPPNTLYQRLRSGFKQLKKFIFGLFPTQKDPEMQMNMHNMNHILFLLQNMGVQNFYTEFTDHGANLGVFIYFKK